MEEAHILSDPSDTSYVCVYGTCNVGLASAVIFDGNHIAMGLVEMLIAGIIMVINQKFFISGFKAAVNLAPNMDTLVAMGSGVSLYTASWSLWL